MMQRYQLFQKYLNNWKMKNRKQIHALLNTHSKFLFRIFISAENYPSSLPFPNPFRGRGITEVGLSRTTGKIPSVVPSYPAEHTTPRTVLRFRQTFSMKIIPKSANYSAEAPLRAPTFFIRLTFAGQRRRSEREDTRGGAVETQETKKKCRGYTRMLRLLPS